MVELISLFIPFITLFIIMDPFASIPPFLMLTRNCKEEEMKSTANKAVLIAAVIAFIFVFGGMEILKILSITLSDFKIAGGMVLVLLGLENVLNFTLSNGHNKKDVVDSVAVLIATPLLTGPGLISSLIIMVQTFAIGNVLIALSATLFISLIILRNAIRVKKILGDKIIFVFSKIMGLLLIALGISYIRAGWAI